MSQMPEGLDHALALLEREWDIPDGFFYLLRQGSYRPERVGPIEQALNALVVSEDASLPRRFVSLTWWIPMFMEWQVDRVREAGGDVGQLQRDIDRLLNALDRVLGVP